ncbi:hypothetical protein AB0F88_41235 [Streptosporangium sp. NPDC023963]|uniref:hypothetical protein n=1 Tax=Streptosporangium sp. NPDC023963 TaxID=3155608 RepID=UPI0034289756
MADRTVVTGEPEAPVASFRVEPVSLTTEEPLVKRSHKHWSDLSARQQAAILTLASVELSLTATAAADLWCRPAGQIRGSKTLWWPLLLIQPIGPIIYLTLGRAPFTG